MRFKAKYGYSGGYLSSVQDYTGNVNGPVLWNLNLLDARLNAVSESYGNGLWLQNGFDALTGVPLTRQSGTGGQSSNVQNLSYAWDTAGNLTRRQDLRQSLTESFTYDALDRLTLASGPAVQSTSIGYDAIGNLTPTTGIGTYTYHATRKHAVVSAGGASYGLSSVQGLSRLPKKVISGETSKKEPGQEGDFLPRCSVGRRGLNASVLAALYRLMLPLCLGQANSGGWGLPDASIVLLETGR